MELELVLEGPGHEASVVSRGTVVLAAAEAEWSVELPYAHSEIVAGQWNYFVRARADGVVLTSEPVGYRLRKFYFGA